MVTRDCWAVCARCTVVVEWLSCIAPGIPDGDLIATGESTTAHWQRSPECRGTGLQRSAVRETTLENYVASVKIIQAYETSARRAQRASEARD